MTPRTPNLFLVGPPKAATTALHGYLRALPDVFMSTPKELRALAPDMYPERAEQSDEDYVSRFVTAPLGARYLGESSPFYLRSAVAPQRVASLSPSARIVVVIRHPVELVRSLHQQNVKDRAEPLLSLEAALEAESDRVRGVPKPSSAFHTTAPQLQYVRTAMLAPQIERWLGYVPRAQIHFVSYSNLVNRPRDELDRLHKFLEIDAPVGAFGEANPSVEVRFTKLAHWFTAPPAVLRAAIRVIPRRARGRVVHGAWQWMLRAESRQVSQDRLYDRLEPLFREDMAAVERLTGLPVQRSVAVGRAAT
jgi:hypothetical protein